MLNAEPYYTQDTNDFQLKHKRVILEIQTKGNL